jgi:predicted Fe-Mo cluster-binding NifX family protein
MEPIKVAVATADGVSVCDHLARSFLFLIAEVENGRVLSTSVRDRSHGPCGNHAKFTDVLHGCRAVLCGGIGEGAANSLAAHGIEPVVVAGKHSADEALALYLEGKLLTSDERICLCHEPGHTPV